MVRNHYFSQSIESSGLLHSSGWRARSVSPKSSFSRSSNGPDQSSGASPGLISIAYQLSLSSSSIAPSKYWISTRSSSGSTAITSNDAPSSVTYQSPIIGS